MLGGMSGTPLRAQATEYLVVALLHLSYIGLIGKQTGELSLDVGLRHAMSHQLLHHLGIGNEVDQRDVLHTEQMALEETDETTHRRVVADSLGYTEEGGLQGGRT